MKFNHCDARKMVPGWVAGLVAAGVLSTTAGWVHAAPIEIISDENDYTLLEQGGSTGAHHENPAGHFTVGIEDMGCMGARRNRAIYQFDISTMEQEAAEAEFSTWLMGFFGTERTYDVQVWGSTLNRSASKGVPEEELSVIDPNLSSEMYDNTYVPLLGDGNFVTPSDDPGEYTLDVTDFINDRYQNYLSTGDSYVFLRLQPNTNDADGHEGAYYFGHSGSFDDGRASLSITPVPEPGSLALMGLGGLLLVGRRRKG